MATASDRAAADALAAEIRSAYRRGAVAVGFSPDNVVAMLGFGVAASLLGWAPKTDAQRRLEANLKDLGGRIRRWEVVFRSWAERGQRDDGSSYSWERWTQYAREDLARQLRELLNETVSESLFLRFGREVVLKTAEDANKALNPFAWPAWAKAAAVAGAVVVTLAVVYPYAAPVLRRV